MIAKNASAILITFFMSFGGGCSSIIKDILAGTGLIKPLAGSSMLPLEDVTFLLYTSYDGLAEELKLDETRSILRSRFNSSNLTKIMTHGWQDDANADFMAVFKKAFLKNGHYNYISVDWSKCAFQGYAQSLYCIQIVGDYIGLLIEKLANVANLRLDDVHLLGHSLGAHTMSFVSRKYKNREIGRITVFKGLHSNRVNSQLLESDQLWTVNFFAEKDEVTGLDPASPIFELAGPSFSLDASDAKIVDIIHTGLDAFGMKKPMGTIDFYPNGGYQQPGCKPRDTFDEDCNHASSYLYFAETIPLKNRDKYIAKKCDSLEDAVAERCNGKPGVMGIDADKSDPGIYYIKINEPPTL